MGERDVADSLLIHNCAILDPAHSDRILEGRDILIAGAAISSIEPTGQQVSDTIIPGTDRLVIPGLINAHTHSAENFLKGINDRQPLEMWLPFVYGAAGVYSPRDVYLSCLIGAVEMLKTGSTSVIDHCWMSPGITPDRLDAAMEAYRDAGIRTAFAPLVTDTDYVTQYAIERGHALEDSFFANRYENAPPWEETLGHLKSFFRTWDRAEQGRLRCMTGPGGLQWCSDRLLEDCIELSRSHGAGFHIHINETFIQDWANRKRFGKSGIAYMKDAGILGPDVSMPHSVWVDDHDLDLIAEAGAVPVHNPMANSKMGSGWMPLRKMLDRELPVAIGVDGACSNDHQNLFEAIRMGCYMHNNLEPDHRKHISADEAVSMATRGGGAAMLETESLGRIQVGCPADLVLLDRKSIPWVPTNDPVRNLVYCEGGQSVRTVLVAGKVVVEEGQVRTVNEADVTGEVLEAVKSRGEPDWPGESERNRTVALYERFCDDLTAEGRPIPGSLQREYRSLTDLKKGNET